MKNKINSLNTIKHIDWRIFSNSKWEYLIWETSWSKLNNSKNDLIIKKKIETTNFWTLNKDICPSIIPVVNSKENHVNLFINIEKIFDKETINYLTSKLTTPVINSIRNNEELSKKLVRVKTNYNDLFNIDSENEMSKLDIKENLINDFIWDNFFVKNSENLSDHLLEWYGIKYSHQSTFENESWIENLYLPEHTFEQINIDKVNGDVSKIKFIYDKINNEIVIKNFESDLIKRSMNSNKSQLIIIDIMQKEMISDFIKKEVGKKNIINELKEKIVNWEFKWKNSLIIENELKKAMEKYNI